jgi:hypothetical protein
LETPGVPAFPEQDENGVDLGLIDYCLSLTPLERLRLVERNANSILYVWKTRGIDWSGSKPFSDD